VRKYERSREFQVTHLALDLDLGFSDRSVSGTATLTFVRRALSGTKLRLDAHGLSIAKVELRLGRAKMRTLTSSEYSYDSEELQIAIPETVEDGVVTVTYRAVPRLGLYFLSPDKQVPDRPKQVWSQCQDEDGKHWFPCQDKPHVKMTYELKARVPSKMSVLSGGELKSKKTVKKGITEFHFHLNVPTPAYLVTLVVGEFDEWTESVSLPSGKKVPLRYLVPKGKKVEGKRAFERTADAIQLFSEKTGVDYPFERYSQVVVADFIFGGMENTTATTMYEHILVDKTAAIDVEAHDLVAHELAHQWFGDLVTCRDWSHAWLNEGFATYFEHVEREARLGQDEYEHNVTVDLNQYLAEARGDYKRPIVCRDYEEPIDLFDRHLYQKGGLVLHMLRQHIGDGAFWGAIEVYLKKHGGGIVETNDLMRSFEERSGLSLEKFFDQWVYRPGHPELKVNVSYDAGILTVDVEQIQKGENVAVFELLFDIEVESGGETHTLSRRIDEKKSSLVMTLDERPDWVSIDPSYRIAAPMTLNAPADMLRRLLVKGKKARARRMAALALGRRQDPETIAALKKCLNNEKETWMVRSKAADSLSRIRGEAAEEALLKGSDTAHPKVRRAVAEALGALRTKTSADVLVQMTRDKSYLVTAAAARGLGRSGDSRALRVLSGLLKKDSWSEVIRAGALAGLASSRDEGAVPILMEWTEYGKPLRARRAALAALPRLGEGKKVREHLEDMLHDRDPHVRSSVLRALGSLGDAKAKSAIAELLEQELDGGVRGTAREVLSDLGKDGVSGLKEMRQENQKLKGEVTTLKTRLSRLEQAIGAKKSSSKGGSSAKKASAKKATSKKSGVTRATGKPASKKKGRKG